MLGLRLDIPIRLQSGRTSSQTNTHPLSPSTTQIRFVDGQPYAIYLSEHSAGSAYYWDVMTFTTDGLRPVTYIANGSHANYATVGTQEYTWAGPIVTDVTNAGYACECCFYSRISKFLHPLP